MMRIRNQTCTARQYIIREKKNSSISLKVDCLIRATIHPQRGRVVDKERTEAQFVGNRPLAG